MKNTTVPAQYRQGDVMVERVDKLPAGLKKLTIPRGGIVLAQGKGEGRSHVIVDPKASLFQDNDGNRYLELVGKTLKSATGMRGRFPIVVDAPTRVTVVADDTNVALVFNKADIAMPARGGRPEIAVAGNFALLRHDCAQPDHNTLALPRGSYRIVRQREFNQGDVRNVID